MGVRMFGVRMRTRVQQRETLECDFGMNGTFGVRGKMQSSFFVCAMQIEPLFASSISCFKGNGNIRPK